MAPQNKHDKAAKIIGDMLKLLDTLKDDQMDGYQFHESESSVEELVARLNRWRDYQETRSKVLRGEL